MRNKCIIIKYMGNSYYKLYIILTIIHFVVESSSTFTGFINVK